MGIIYTLYDVLDVDATYKVSCKSVQWFWRIFCKVHNIYGHGDHLGHVPNTSCNLILFSSYEKACIQNLAENGPLLSEKSQF